jgi:hypothetical protein
MFFLKHLAFAFVAALFVASSALAQSPLAVTDAELAVPFGA